MGAVRYRAEPTYIAGISWQVDIWDADYSSSVSYIDCAEFDINSPGQDSDRFNPILGSEFKGKFLIENSGHQGLLDDISSDEEERFAIIVYKNSSFYWAGWIVCDLQQYPNEPFSFYADISATDGLKDLENIDYDNSGTFYTGLQKFKDILINALTKSNLSQFWGTNDEFLQTIVDWWDANHPARAASIDPLDKSAVYSQYIRKRNSAKSLFTLSDDDEPLSCLDVITEICVCWGARIQLSEGVWRVIQVNAYADSTVYSRSYKKGGTSYGYESALNLRKTIDGSTYYLLADHIFTTIPPLKRAQIEYQFSNYGSLIPFSAATNGQGYYDPAVGIGRIDQDDFYLIDLKFLMNNYNTLLPTYFVGYWEMQITITTDGGTVYYLKGDNLGTTVEWTTTNTDVYKIYFKWDDLQWYIVQEFRLTLDLPQAPADGTTTFKLEFIEFQDLAGNSIAGTYTNNHRLGFAYVYYIDFDDTSGDIDYVRDPALSELHYYTNPSTNNKLTADLGFKIFGGGTNMVAPGAIIVYDGSSNTYYSTLWEHANDGDDLDITDLLIQEYLSGQKTPKLVTSGTICGSFSAHHSIVYDSKVWVFMGGSFLAKEETMNGQWFEIARVTSGLSKGTAETKYERIDILTGILMQSTEKVKKLLYGYTEVETIDTDTTLEEGDSSKHFQIDTSSGDVEVTLYPATDAPGYELRLTLIDDTNTATLTPDGDTIDGASSFEFSVLYETVIIKSINDEWVIIN